MCQCKVDHTGIDPHMCSVRDHCMGPVSVSRGMEGTERRQERERDGGREGRGWEGRNSEGGEGMGETVGEGWEGRDSEGGRGGERETVREGGEGSRDSEGGRREEQREREWNFSCRHPLE